MQWEERLRLAEETLAQIVAEHPGETGGPEVRGSAVACAAAGVTVARVAEITGATADEVMKWIADYRERSAQGAGWYP
jgi:hypothetical protein